METSNKGDDMQSDMDIFKQMLDIDTAVSKLSELEQVECPVKDHFAYGQYIRETSMPAGTFAIGKKHRYSTVNIILKGKLSVYNGKGNPILHIEAPYIWVSEAGVQKMAYFHEDTVWVNAHPTHDTDIDKIESEFIIDTTNIEEIE